MVDGINSLEIIFQYWQKCSFPMLKFVLHFILDIKMGLYLVLDDTLFVKSQ